MFINIYSTNFYIFRVLLKYTKYLVNSAKWSILALLNIRPSGFQLLGLPVSGLRPCIIEISITERKLVSLQSTYTFRNRNQIFPKAVVALKVLIFCKQSENLQMDFGMTSLVNYFELFMNKLFMNKLFMNNSYVFFQTLFFS